jgi:nicotinate dehydrogenase subunit B
MTTVATTSVVFQGCLGPVVAVSPASAGWEPGTPALVENQIVGQMVQATSRVLKEGVVFDKSNVISLDWVSYPVLRFAEHPDVVPVVVQRLEEPSTGAGEEVMGATAAAIANAFFDATGARLQQYPMTPPRVLAALAKNHT